MEHGIRLVPDQELQDMLVHAINRGRVAAAAAIWRERDRRAEERRNWVEPRFQAWLDSQNIVLVA